MTIDELIKEGSNFRLKYQEAYLEPAGYGMLKQVPGIHYLENADVFATWIQKCIRFLAQNFPNDISLEKFQNVDLDSLKQGTIYALVGSLKALKETPIICESKKALPASMNNITLNQNQTQNQTLRQNISPIMEIIKNELRGREMHEIEEILSSDKTPEEKKNTIFSKLKSFGENVAAGIVATLLTQGLK